MSEKEQIRKEIYFQFARTFNLFSPSEKKITHNLFKIFQASVENNNKYIIKVGICSEKGVCARTGYSRRTVINFNKKMREYSESLEVAGLWLMKIEKETVFENIYEINPLYFEALLILESAGFFKGKSYEQLVLSKMSNNQDFISELLKSKIGNCPTQSRFLPRIYNILFNIIKKITVPEEVPDFLRKIKGWFEDLNLVKLNWGHIGLSKSQKKYFMRKFSLEALEAAINDFWWYASKSRIVKNVYGFLKNRVIFQQERLNGVR